MIFSIEKAPKNPLACSGCAEIDQLWYLDYLNNLKIMNSRTPSGAKNILWFKIFHLKGFSRNAHIFVGKIYYKLGQVLQIRSIIINWGITVITHNSPLSFKLIHFLLCIKGSNESSNFENFLCCGENLPNSSCRFPNRKSAFLQILHHSLVSWYIAPLYFFSSNNIYFGQK